MNPMKIVVIEALGLHLGYLGCYGNDWVATPSLDRLALEGVVFDWHFADQPELRAATPWTRRSVGTGHYVRPGDNAPTPGFAIAPRVVSIDSLESFADRALAAVATNDAWIWIDGPSLLPPWMLEVELLEAYFDEDDAEEGLRPWHNPPLDVMALDDAQILRLQNTYASVVTFFDAQLGKLLDHVRDKEDLLICVTARSGLPLGEHGMIGTPRPALHDELVHVPLVMRLPRKEKAGLRIAALTQPIDLLPTLLAALNQSIPSMHGRSLLPLIREEAETARPFALSMMRVGEHESWLMRTPDHALHMANPTAAGETPKSQLFMKPEDRWEVNDLHQQQIESAEEMEAVLRRFVQSLSEPDA